jgi:hypothetical protein
MGAAAQPLQHGRTSTEVVPWTFRPTAAARPPSESPSSPHMPISPHLILGGKINANGGLEGSGGSSGLRPAGDPEGSGNLRARGHGLQQRYRAPPPAWPPTRKQPYGWWGGSAPCHAPPRCRRRLATRPKWPRRHQCLTSQREVPTGSLCGGLAGGGLVKRWCIPPVALVVAPDHLFVRTTPPPAAAHAPLLLRAARSLVFRKGEPSGSPIRAH